MMNSNFALLGVFLQLFILVWFVWTLNSIKAYVKEMVELLRENGRGGKVSSFTPALEPARKPEED